MTVDDRDILESVERMYPRDYPSQAGALRAILTNVLVSVEARDPKMYQEIVEFEMRCQEREMRCQERMKALEELAEADKDLL